MTQDNNGTPLGKILLKIEQMDIGEAKKVRLRACIRSKYEKGIRDFDLEYLASCSRKHIQSMGYEL